MYLTIADIWFYFNGIQDHLNYCIKLNDFDQYMLANSINQKIENYWEILDDAITITLILDLWNKVSLFELGKLITKAINVL